MLFRSSEAAAAPRTGAALAQVRAAAEQVAAASDRACIVHGDLVHANILDGAQLWLLDWEYAQLADPIYDAGCVLAYYPEAQPHAARLLEATGLAGPEHAARLHAAIRVYQGLTWLWHQARLGAAGAGR